MKTQWILLTLGCSCFVVAATSSLAQGAKNDGSACWAPTFPLFQDYDYEPIWVPMERLRNWHPEIEAWYYSNHNLVFDALQSEMIRAYTTAEFIFEFRLSQDGSLAQIHGTSNNKDALKNIQHIKFSQPPKSLVNRSMLVRASNSGVRWFFDSSEEVASDCQRKKR